MPAPTAPAPPTAFGRGVIINAGAAPPVAWSGADRIVVDDSVLTDPAPTVELLHLAWLRRTPVVVEFHVDPARFRAAQSVGGEPWQHTPATEPYFDRLHFLVWANNYDGRGD